MLEALYIVVHIVIGVVVLAGIACALNLDAPDFTDGDDCLLITVCIFVWPVILAFVLGWGLSRLLVIILTGLIEMCKDQKRKFFK